VSRENNIALLLDINFTKEYGSKVVVFGVFDSTGSAGKPNMQLTTHMFCGQSRFNIYVGSAV
jgi:copper homeostasis protein CutC